MTTATKEKKLYSLPEALEIIPMSRAGLYAAVSKGKIESVRIGTRIFIPAWAIAELTEKPVKS